MFFGHIGVWGFLEKTPFGAGEKILTPNIEYFQGVCFFWGKKKLKTPKTVFWTFWGMFWALGKNPQLPQNFLINIGNLGKGGFFLGKIKKLKSPKLILVLEFLGFFWAKPRDSGQFLPNLI